MNGYLQNSNLRMQNYYFLVRTRIIYVKSYKETNFVFDVEKFISKTKKVKKTSKIINKNINLNRWFNYERNLFE